jgi:uncharacterized coiled-coil protein SlyX
MQITTDTLELRVLELEDTVAVLLSVLRSVNQMIANLNEIAGGHNKVLLSLTEAVELMVGRANTEEDVPPWTPDPSRL